MIETKDIIEILPLLGPGLIRSRSVDVTTPNDIPEEHTVHDQRRGLGVMNDHHIRGDEGIPRVLVDGV